jgi:hypothetical protein
VLSTASISQVICIFWAFWTGRPRVADSLSLEMFGGSFAFVTRFQ